MPSTGRALGPFADVSTERVEGAYEICLGTDDEGRRVEILTLGTTSSKDPSRRRLLADAVNWANSTHTPADAPILTIELEAEQPYVVALHDERLRGIGRVLDWLLRMGPSTGPLQRITAPIPQHLMRPQAPVSGPVVPPPVSPAMAPPAALGVWRARRNSAPFIASVVAILALIVFGGGALAVWIAQEPDTVSNNADAGPGKEPGAAEPTEKETLDDDLPPKLLPETTGSWTPENASEAEVYAPDGWPLAWRVDKRMECDDAEIQATCTFGNTDAAKPEDAGAEVVVTLERCPGRCDEQTRLEMGTETSSRVDYDTWYEKSGPEAPYRLSMVHFFATEDEPDEFYTVMVVGEAVGEGTIEMVERTVNDIYTQTS
ncbi:hypothetical protein [Phytomonospora endophytica]|uniref:Uncharacterized protein n=1 Tax=Phytomonospora endophytica TaxID=714109 RepID=A0A841FWF2_9ACTN|nr:hypothetical protein [Phytomonospora endophytica]MBB6039083.1 hypothetical protein [Phytomonospora endophytica]GIG63721.1 hypothetical protein Pen01_00160 [Phytomonospora endophytica]